jgi:hypothetical protein
VKVDCKKLLSKRDKSVRAKTIHVTNHAKERWLLRVSKFENDNVYEIINAVKNSQIISKKHFLPYGLPRLSNLVYSINNGIVFILESISIEEYRLVTVITKEKDFL